MKFQVAKITIYPLSFNKTNCGHVIYKPQDTQSKNYMLNNNVHSYNTSRNATKLHEKTILGENSIKIKWKRLQN